MTCEIAGCEHEADRCATYRHPDPGLRWSANLCREHAHEAAEKARGGAGELTYAAVTAKD